MKVLGLAGSVHQRSDAGAGRRFFVNAGLLFPVPCSTEADDFSPRVSQPLRGVCERPLPSLWNLLSPPHPLLLLLFFCFVFWRMAGFRVYFGVRVAYPSGDKPGLRPRGISAIRIRDTFKHQRVLKVLCET